jgi:hypothetical protein
VFTLRVILGSSDDPGNNSTKTSASLHKVLDLITTQIQDFCLKRDSNISHIFLQGLFDKQSHLLRPLIPTLAQHITSENVRVFCRTLVCSWLTAVISKPAVEEMGHKKWTAFAADVVSKILKVLLETEESQMKPKYTVHLLNLLGKILSVTENEQLIKQIISSELTKKLLALRRMNSDVRTACNRLTGILQHRLKLKTSIHKDDSQIDEKKRKRDEGQKPSADNNNDKATAAAAAAAAMSKKRKFDSVVSSDIGVTISADRKSKKAKHRLQGNMD